MADGTAGGAGAVARPEAAELAAALDAIPARVFLMDAQHRIRWTNAAGAAYFGQPPEALAGRTVPDLIGAEEFAGSRAEREAAVAGEPRRWSGWARIADGSRRHVQRLYLPHAGPDGPGYLVVAEDDTERAAAEAQARRADALLREALDGLRLGVGIEESEGRLVQCNAPYAAFYGRCPESLTGLGFAERIALLAPRLAEIDGTPVQDAGAAVARIFALREAGVSQAELATRDGRRFLNRSAPVEGGGRVVIYDDVTEQRARDRETTEARRMLVDAVASLPAGVAIEDASGRIRLCNAVYAGFYGVAPEALVGLDFDARMAVLGRRLVSVGDMDARGDGAGALRRLAAARRDSLEPLELGFADGRRCLIHRAETGDGGRVVVYTDITELRRVEAALRASWETLTGALEACPVPISMSRAADSTIIYENPAKRALMAERDAAEKGRNAGAYWRDPEQHRAAREALLRDGRIDDLEVCMIRADGSELWLSMSARLATVRGEAVFVTATSDLTDRRRAEAALREGWETVTSVLEACPTPVSMSRAADAELLYANPAAEALLGYAPGGWKGRRISDLWRDPAEHAAAVGALRRDGRLDAFESRFVTADGREVALSFSSRIARLRDETVFVSAAVDLTERLRAEAVLRDSWETVTSVMESCPTPVAMTRAADGVILYANPALERTLGLRPGEAQGKRAPVHWRDPAEHAATAARLRRDGRINGVEACFLRADGSELWLALSGRTATFRGEPVFVTSSVDLTAQRAQEAELARQREIAHQAEKLSALGELLAGVSHELNNPLTVIVGEAAILRETAATDWVRDRAERLADAADRCARIVRSFLAMARQGPARREAVDLCAVARAAAELAAPEIRTAGAELALDLDPTAPAALGDVDQLRQVALNLLVNAAHATAETPGPRRISLRVGGHPDGGAVLLTVADSGPGVPAAIAGRIFEPLFTTKPVGRGSGLGLALCHRLVAAHGGRLSLRNPGAAGAEFEMALPVGAAATGETARPPEAGRGLRVLVVDDDVEVARTTSALLQVDGHAVTTAASGREALALAASSPFDLVITDMRMPEMDGLEFWRRLAAQTPALAEATAFATGDLLSPDVAAALRATGRPVLEKPFLPGDLRGIVAAANDRRAFASGDRAVGRTPR